MTCINKNTVFYKTLVSNNYDSKEIAKIDLALESESFKQWYGLGERDTFSNPVIIKDIYLQNDKGQQITLNNLLNGEPYEKRKYYKADLTYIDKVDKLLGELRIGIATRINNFKGTDYSKALKNLLEEIDKLDKTDFVNALNKHTEYILKTVTALEDKFVAFDKVNKSKLSKEELTKNDEDFKNFLLQSNSFLETFSKIDQLEDPKIEGLEIGKLIKLLKDTENRVTDLRNRVDAEAETHTRNKLEKLIKNPEIRQGVIDFLAAQVDESGIQRWMDALGDSHVPFLAAVNKFYMLNMSEKDDEVNEMRKDWRKFIKKFNGKFDDFLDRVLEVKEDEKSGIEKRTGRFIQEYEDKYYNTLNWYKRNLEEEKVTKAQYDKWMRKNHKVNSSTPIDKWKNSAYTNLSEEDKNNLKEITKTLSYLVEHSKNNIIKKGYLPAVPKNPSKKDETEDKGPDVKTITETDEIVKFIPFNYIKKINSDNLNYDLAKTMETFIDTALTNKYKSKMELDMKLFKEQLKQLKVKQTNSAGKPLYNRIKSQLAGENVQHEVSAIGSNTEKHFNDWLDAVFYEDFNLEEGKLTEWANKIQNFTSLRAMGFNVLSGVNNSIMGNMNNRIEAAGGRFYTAKDYRNANKLYFGNITNFIADMKKDESSNYLTAFIKEMDILVSQDELASKPEGWLATAQHKLRMVKDAAYFMQHIGEHQVQNVSLIAMANSHRIVDGEILSFNEFFEKNKLNISDIAKNESKEAALNAIKENAKLEKELLEKFETYTKVIDAYELNGGYAELKKDLGITKEDIFEFKQRVIGINQKLHGIYNTEDAGMIQRHALGRLAIQFRKWMRPGWNKRFGAKFGKTIYNEKIRDYEQGMYVTTAKYLSSPFVTSWQENKKNQANIALVAYKTLVDGFKDTIFNAKIRWHSMTEIEKANVRRTATEFLFLVSVTTLGFLAKHLKGEDDDDEKMKTKMLVFTLYQADRLFGELTNFTPIGVVREGNRLFSSPSPVFNTFEDIGKLSTALFLYPFRDEEDRKFNSGTYHGQDRVSVYAQDLMPFWNQFKRLGNMNANNQRYGIFR